MVHLSLHLHCWGLNDPFCCALCSRESQCFLMGWTPKIGPSCKESGCHRICGFLHLLQAGSRLVHHSCRAHGSGSYWAVWSTFWSLWAAAIPGLTTFVTKAIRTGKGHSHLSVSFDSSINSYCLPASLFRCFCRLCLLSWLADRPTHRQTMLLCL